MISKLVHFFVCAKGVGSPAKFQNGITRILTDLINYYLHNSFLDHRLIFQCHVDMYEHINK